MQNHVTQNYEICYASAFIVRCNATNVSLTHKAINVMQNLPYVSFTFIKVE